MRKYYTDIMGKANWDKGHSFVAFDLDPNLIKHMGEIYSFSFVGPLVPLKHGYLYYVESGKYQLSEFEKVEQEV